MVALSRATVARQLSIQLPNDIQLDQQAEFGDLFGTAVDPHGRSIGLTLAPRGSAVLLSETGCRPEEFDQ